MIFFNNVIHLPIRQCLQFHIAQKYCDLEEIYEKKKCSNLFEQVVKHLLL